MSSGKKQQKNRRDSVKNPRFHVLPPEHSGRQSTRPISPARQPCLRLIIQTSTQFQRPVSPAALRNLPPPQFHSEPFRRGAAVAPFPTLAATSGRDDKASGFRPWLWSSDAFRSVRRGPRCPHNGLAPD